MRSYAVSGTQNTCSSSRKTALGLISATTIRPAIKQILIGASGTPADNALAWIVQRFTAAGTSTGVTPKPLDPANPASIATAGENHTVEPTYTSGEVMFEISLNQKASYLWQALPGGEIILPATAANGVGVGASNATYTGALDACIHFDD